MPIFYQVQRRTSSFEQERKSRYYLIAKSWDSIGYDELIENMVRHASLTPSEARSALDYLLETIPDMLKLGHTVRLGNLGYLRPIIRSEGSDTPEEATVNKVKDVRVRFIPGKKLREEIKNISLERFPKEEKPRETVVGKKRGRPKKNPSDTVVFAETIRRSLAEGLSVEQTARILGISTEKVQSMNC